MSLPHTDFWTWSLERYERAGAAETLLRLQDEHGLNVNLLLWCCWSAEFFDAISGPVMREAEKATRDWNARVTAPLRSVRRRLKNGDDGDKKQRKALRKMVKDAELEAEKVEQTRLEALAAAHLAPLASTAGAAGRAANNLRLYAEQTEAGDAAPLTAQLSALIGKVVDETP